MHSMVMLLSPAKRCRGMSANALMLYAEIFLVGHSAVFSLGICIRSLWSQFWIYNSLASAILIRGCPKFDCIRRGGVFGILGFGIR